MDFILDIGWLKVCYFWRPPVVGNQRPDSDMISTINPGPWPQSTPEHWQVMTRMIFTVIMMVTSLVMADVTFPETPVVKRGKTVRVAEDTEDISITLRSGVRLWLLGHNQYFNIDHCIVFQKHYFSIRLFIHCTIEFSGSLMFFVLSHYSWYCLAGRSGRRRRGGSCAAPWLVTTASTPAMASPAPPPVHSAAASSPSSPAPRWLVR